MAITVQMRTEISQLYVALFGRAPDGEGLGFWVGLRDAGQSLTQIANAMYATAPARAYYPSFLTNQEIIASFYLNVLGRPADAEGLAFWTAKLNAAGATPGSVITQMIGVVANYTGTDPAGLISQALFNNKVTVAQFYGEHNGSIAGAAVALTGVTSDPATVAAAEAAILASIVPGQTFTLTAGLDTVLGGSGNDSINANFASALGVLDSINGAGGTDTLNVFGVDGLGGAAAINIPTLTNVTSVEILNLAGASTVTADTTGWTGLQQLNVVQSAGDAIIFAGDTTAVSVAGADAAVTVDGGSTQTVTLDVAGGDVFLSGATGAVTVSVADQNTQDIVVNDGTAVNVTSSADTTPVTGVIYVGNVTKPTGAVSVTSHLSNDAAPAANMQGGDIFVSGGTTVNVTQTATQAVSATAGANSTITQSNVVVIGGSATTAVSVNQSAAVTAAPTALAVAAVTESASAVFTALAGGASLTVGGLTFTAGAAGTTAAQTAAAFANLTTGDTQGSSTLGVYTGALTGWTSGGASGTGSTTVVFTSTDAGDVGDLPFAGAVTVTTTQGVAAATAAGKGGIANGVVQIVDAGWAIPAVDTISTATVNGYVFGVVASDALTSLALANSSGAFVVDNTVATTLGLAVNNVKHAVVLDGAGATYTNLFVAATGADSAFALTGNAVKALDVSGDKALDLTGSALAALQTVTVGGSTSLTLDASGATVTAVNTSGNTGTSTIKLDGSKATYTGGAGVDNVTLTSATVSKAIALGAGNDSIKLAAGTTAITGSIDGGDGTDTLAMDAADAATASAGLTFETKISGFEKLSLGANAAAATVDLANMDDISYVISAGNTAALTLNNMANAGTLELTAAGTTQVNVNLVDATGTADSLNVITKLSTAGINYGTVAAAGVESIALTVTDTSTKAGIQTATLALADTALKTVTVTGNANLTLTTDSLVLTSVNGSAMSGALTATTNGAVAETITGGSGKDVLTAHVGSVADVLIGGAGDDTLTGNAGLSTLTGGAGNDLFVVNAASLNVNSYATITDFAAGDRIAMTGADSFVAAKVTLGDTAVFQDYANAVINTVGLNDVAWFQFGGNTYLVMDATADTATFTEGQDFVVKLTGLVDLSGASFNDTSDTISL
jgi:S-layer protein